MLKTASKLTQTNLRHSDVTLRFRNVAIFVAVNVTTKSYTKALAMLQP